MRRICDGAWVFARERQRLEIQPVSEERWRWAQRGQRRAQELKREGLRGKEGRMFASCTVASLQLAELLRGHGLEAHSDDVVIEVGSGAHGLIWCWPSGRRYGVDPLADFYREQFGFLQDGPVESVPACGEALPFDDASAYLLLCDNVLDHARDPKRILHECRRVIRGDGALYLTFDEHHWVWGLGARLYNRLVDSGLRLQVPAFPNHPFHFQRRSVERLLESTGWSIAWKRSSPRSRKPRRPRDWAKLLFYKDQRVCLLAKPVSER